MPAPSMLKYIQQNKKATQELAKSKISLFLKEMNYQLVTDIHTKVGIETRIFQWTNNSTNHCIQLIWDGKEEWFDLGEFKYSNNLNYLNAKQILVVPLHGAKLFRSKNYFIKKFELLIEALKQEKLEK